MSAFLLPIDIDNRALQHCGQKRLVTLADQSKNASEVIACYDKLREAELRRNVWRFSIREVILRPFTDGLSVTGTTLSGPTMILVPEVYDPAKTYVVGSIVSFTDGFTYIATGAAALATAPGAAPWTQYFGPMTVSCYDTTGQTGYFAGELVYTPAAANPVVYLSLQNSNKDVPTTVPDYDPAVIYNKGATVTYSATVYQSTADLNFNVTPTGAAPWIAVPATQPDQQAGRHWLKLSATLKSLTFVYPLGSGPSSQNTTKNAFLLPNGFLRKAPTDPKQGNLSYLGRPTAPIVDDWLFEGNWLVSAYSNPLLLRFVADIKDVSAMDAMFCEGLGARIGMEVCESLTQSTERLTTIGQQYKLFMSEARTVNGIETGSEEAPLDDYLACRL